MPGKVFVSYRRDDSSYIAGRLRDQLVVEFGEDNVFFDVDSVGFGQDFREVIQRTLAEVDAVLVVIGDSWDTKRLAVENDYVRLEIQEALDQNKLVIPVLVGSSEVPAAADLPEPLQPLAYRNAAPLRRDPDFHVDSSRLISDLASTIGRPQASRRPSNKTNQEPQPNTSHRSTHEAPSKQAAATENRSHAAKPRSPIRNPYLGYMALLLAVPNVVAVVIFAQRGELAYLFWGSIALALFLFFLWTQGFSVGSEQRDST